MSKLYLIPSTLGDNDPREVLPASVLELLPSIGTYIVENERTVRRFLSRAGLRGSISELKMVELSEHTTPAEVEAMAALFDAGDVGLVSEAGLPAVADPGAQVVALCHRKGIEVVPLVGPSSLMLALMGSGLNGQSFAFRGYISAKTDERREQIRSLEKTSRSLRQTQILIETPYRNDSLLKDLAACLGGEVMLCAAADLTLPTQTIITRKVCAWRELLSKDASPIGKRPCVFLILA
ncbi:MAG: SAM-dependent methyltransferase [Bacteroidales bacterium]|nr:SAM-dependent methyltransferase [Candidatus Cryptobacteroides aphodequi]